MKINRKIKNKLLILLSILIISLYNKIDVKANYFGGTDTALNENFQYLYDYSNGSIVTYNGVQYKLFFFDCYYPNTLRVVGTPFGSGNGGTDNGGFIIDSNLIFPDGITFSGTGINTFYSYAQLQNQFAGAKIVGFYNAGIAYNNQDLSANYGYASYNGGGMPQSTVAASPRQYICTLYTSRVGHSNSNNCDDGKSGYHASFNNWLYDTCQGTFRPMVLIPVDQYYGVNINPNGGTYKNQSSLYLEQYKHEHKQSCYKYVYHKHRIATYELMMMNEFQARPSNYCDQYDITNTYRLGGCTLSEYEPYERQLICDYATGKVVNQMIILDTPVRSGYTFIGWSFVDKQDAYFVDKNGNNLEAEDGIKSCATNSGSVFFVFL